MSHPTGTAFSSRKYLTNSICAQFCSELSFLERERASVPHLVLSSGQLRHLSHFAHRAKASGTRATHTTDRVKQRAEFNRSATLGELSKQFLKELGTSARYRRENEHRDRGLSISRAHSS